MTTNTSDVAAQALRIAANFIAEYYTALADAPANLTRYYAADAEVQHGTCHTLADCVNQLLQNASAVRRVDIDSLQARYTTGTTEPHIELTVKGVFFTASDTSGSEGRGFVQVMVLRQLKADVYAVVRDTLTSDLLSHAHAMPDSSQPAAPTSEGDHPDAEVAVSEEKVDDAATPHVLAPVASMGETYETKTNEEMPSKAGAEDGDDSHAGKQPASYAECVKKSKVSTAPRAAVRRVTDTVATGTKAAKETTKRAATATSGTRAGHPPRTPGASGGVAKVAPSSTSIRSHVKKSEPKAATAMTTRPIESATAKATTASRTTRPIRGAAKTVEKSAPEKASQPVKHTKSVTTAVVAKGGKTSKK